MYRNLIFHSDQGWQYQHKYYRTSEEFSMAVAVYIDYYNIKRGSVGRTEYYAVVCDESFNLKKLCFRY